MLYGRRAHHPQTSANVDAEKARRFILNKAFQYKYSWYLVTAVAGATLLFLIPTYYFVLQNYQIFTDLAYDTHPVLVSHLEREVTWIRVFMIVSFFVVTGITLILGLRMTKNLINPLIQMEKHMRQLMLGQWHISDYKSPENDDFRELSMTYDYFYRALKANTEVELKLIEKLSIDPQNREAYAAWRNLMEIKRARLGITTLVIVRDEQPSEAPKQHRAS